MKAALIASLFALASLHAQDVLLLKNGGQRAGKIAGADEVRLRLEVPLPGPHGVFASVWIPLADIVRIEFARNPERERLLRDPRPEDLGALAAAWASEKFWLPRAKSPAGRVGVVYATVLTQSGRLPECALAWQVFHEIEQRAWGEEDRMDAKQGRLRAMVACGRAGDAVEEARELARITENPAVLIEAKFLLAEADSLALRELIKENPRWQDDPNVIPEQARLTAQALDQYLFAALFFATESYPAARGLWGALQVYEFNGDQRSALECARDLVAWYSSTPFATRAADYIRQLPAELTRHDPEHASPSPQPSPAPPDKKPRIKKTTHEKKK